MVELNDDAMADEASQFRAFFASHDALVEESAVEREEIEMIVVAVSGVATAPTATSPTGRWSTSP